MRSDLTYYHAHRDLRARRVSHRPQRAALRLRDARRPAATRAASPAAAGGRTASWRSVRPTSLLDGAPGRRGDPDRRRRRERRRPDSSQTIKALDYYRLLELRDTIGVPIQPAKADSVPPISCKATVLDYIAAVLDSGQRGARSPRARRRSFPSLRRRASRRSGATTARRPTSILLNRGLKGKIRPVPRPAASELRRRARSPRPSPS